MKYFKPALFTILGLLLFIGKTFSQALHRKSIVFTKVFLLTHTPKDSTDTIRTDTINTPMVSDRYPRLQKTLAFDSTENANELQDAVAGRATCDCAINRMDYVVLFENRDVLSIEIFTAGEGAYPYSNIQRLTVNIHTGKAYSLGNEINAVGRKWIYSTYKTLVKKRITDDFEASHGDEDDHIRDELNQAIGNLGASDMLRDYLFTDKGILFSTVGLLRHAEQVFEPDKEWVVPYKRLKRYIAPRSIIVKGAK
jgi:hypothetical protein